MKQKDQKNPGKIAYFSHGGGPLPLLKDPSHQKMVQFMTDFPTLVSQPDAVVVFSAHWEENTVTIQSGKDPGLVYDYYGFPKEAYEITYPCQGQPEISQKIADLMEKEGISVELDETRPFDHGSYIPMKLMYPKANVPVIQVSLHHSLDPRVHLNMGKALRPLLKENILFIGSGFSFHNMRAFDFRGLEKEDLQNDAFQEALINLCTIEEDEAKRWEKWTSWEKLPQARYCHPREEHLLPLLVCAGMAQKPGSKIFDDYILGKRATAYLW